MNDNWWPQLPAAAAAGLGEGGMHCTVCAFVCAVRRRRCCGDWCARGMNDDRDPVPRRSLLSQYNMCDSCSRLVRVQARQKCRNKRSSSLCDVR
jgi:hypothetical protein